MLYIIPRPSASSISSTWDLLAGFFQDLADWTVDHPPWHTLTKSFLHSIIQHPVRVSLLLFLAGLAVLIVYVVVKHDAGTGAGLMGLFWSAGGGTYRYLQKKKEESEVELPRWRVLSPSWLREQAD